jgi:hypothetical protein
MAVPLPGWMTPPAASIVHRVEIKRVKNMKQARPEARSLRGVIDSG